MVFKANAINNLSLEKKVLTELNHPFLLKAEQSFESDTRFYFFWEYLKGGDLMKNLIKMDWGFSMTQIRFIAAQVILALEWLHENKIIHKDLKPENILLDEDGYVRLWDFNLSRQIDGQKDNRMVGTLEYMAPEVISWSENQGFEVDWWSLGILLYELYYKKTPFYSEKQDELRKNIKKMKIEFPKDYSGKNNKKLNKFHNLIKKLLKRNPK